MKRSIASSRTGVRVLIIEDDRETSTIYSEYLVSQGYRVSATALAREGIRMAQRERPAAILMDLSLPGMDGNTAMRQLKADPATAAIPILAMTASSLDADRRRAHESGCDAFVEKPCRPPQLLKALERVLTRASELGERDDGGRDGQEQDPQEFEPGHGAVGRHDQPVP